jgi:hypothetical protein
MYSNYRQLYSQQYRSQRVAPNVGPRVENTPPPMKFPIEIRIHYVSFIPIRSFWSPSAFNLVSAIYMAADSRATFRPGLSVLFLTYHILTLIIT